MKTEKIILWSVIAVLTLSLAVLSTFNFKKDAGSSVPAGGDYGNIPEACRPPQGQDIQSWTEHLSHHAETQYCLQYFE